jgi:glycosyltransferase involved in cell wall biosynthesis
MPPGVASSSAPLFSVVVLTRNEARLLPRLLYDLEEFRDRDGEVLLVDTGSTDDTIAIAKRRGCRVEVVNDRFDSYLDPNQVAEIERRLAKKGEGPLVVPGQRLFHFANARHYAGDLAASEFVLQLDAADEIRALDIDALNRWIASGTVGSFEYEQIYGDASLRIARFYDRTRYQWEGRVHEVMTATPHAGGAPAARIRCAPSQLQVRHQKDNKTRNYLAGLALQVFESPEKPRWWHYLGRELFYFHYYESAIATLKSHVAMEDAWLTERSQSLCFIAESLDALGRTEEAKDSFLRAFAMDSTRREPLLRLAMLCSRRREFEDATKWVREALRIPRTNAYPELDANYTWVPHSLLYWSLFWLRRRDEARKHWETYLSLVPSENRMKEHARMFPSGEVARPEKLTVAATAR